MSQIFTEVTCGGGVVVFPSPYLSFLHSVSQFTLQGAAGVKTTCSNMTGELRQQLLEFGIRGLLRQSKFHYFLVGKTLVGHKKKLVSLMDALLEADLCWASTQKSSCWGQVTTGYITAVSSMTPNP